MMRASDLKSIHALVAVCMTLVCGSVAQASDERLEGLDGTVKSVMDMLSIPGLSVAIVSGDEVLLTRGYGVRELSNDDAVDEHTLFALGSVSKAFTATALGLLVDDGAIDWDDPLASHITEFRVADPYISLNLTIRDALSHRTGLNPANGLMMANTQIGRDGILKRLAHLEPVLPFRTTFLYNNLMYIAVSEVIPRVTDESWEDLIRVRIFEPLGMNESVANSATEILPENLARPHARIDAAIRAVPYFDMTTAAPAGGILSNAVDMAQWCQAQLNDGQIDGRQQVPTGVIPTTHEPVIHAASRATSEFDHGLQFSFYAMGWSKRDYHGRTMVSHDGGIDGMSAFVSMLPEEDTCVVTLSNLSPAADPHLGLYGIHNWIHDRLIGDEDRNWVSHLDTTMADLKSSRAEQQEQIQAQQAEQTTPSRPLREYVGIFRHPLQGDIVITLDSGELRLLYGETFKAKLEHWHFDTFHAHWDQPGQPPVPIQFQLDTTGQVANIDVGDRFRRVNE